MDKGLHYHDGTKSPRTFRNALYQHLVDHSVTPETATRIAEEAEVYANAYEVYQLRDIEFAAKEMGFEGAKS